MQEAQEAEVRTTTGGASGVPRRAVDAHLRTEVAATASAGLGGRLARGAKDGTLGLGASLSGAAALALASTYRSSGARCSGPTGPREGSLGRLGPCATSVARTVATAGAGTAYARATVAPVGPAVVVPKAKAPEAP